MLTVTFSLASGAIVDGFLPHPSIDALLRDMAEGAGKGGWLQARDADGAPTSLIHIPHIERLDATVVPPPPPEVAVVTVTGLTPTQAMVGGPDLVLSVLGSGFTPESIILFNFGEEPTTFLSSTELTTGVKPSLVSAAVSVPVTVVGAAESVDFTFIASGAPPEGGGTLR